MTQEIIKKLQQTVKSARTQEDIATSVASLRQYIDTVANAKRNEIIMD